MSEKIKKQTDRAFFHDQKSDAFFKSGGKLVVTETDRMYFEDEQEKKIRHAERIRESVENPEAQTEMNVFEGTLNKINRVELEETFKDDEAQKQLLEKRKQEAKSLIKDVIEKAVEYIDKVETNVMSQRADVDAEVKKQMIEASDRSRSNAHNALLSSLYSAIRNISHNFGNISEEAIEKWGEFLETHGQELLMVKRQNFPENVICPDNVNIKDRYSVGEWAGKLQEALSELPPELK